MTRKRKIGLITGILLVAVLVAVALYVHFSLYSVPGKRLGLNAEYPEMKEDSFHHYIDLPIDHGDPGAGRFRGFYVLSPDFFKHRAITFVLTDGQMELVSIKPDFDFFEERLGGSAYVLMSVRGQGPGFFPEVYKNGKADLATATRLLSSGQQVEDIEAVRRDLVARGLLRNGDSINVFGASGAGVLAQQYVSKYGRNVRRLLLESTGAPDLSRQLHQHYSPDFACFNPRADSLLKEVLKDKAIDTASVCNILYQAARNAARPRAEQVRIVESLRKGSWLLSYKLKPADNLSVIAYLVRSPKEIAVRVRWFELVGADLLDYDPRKGINLLYEFSRAILPDFIDFCKTTHYRPRDFAINRDFAGEVLILKGREDVVFGDSVNRAIQAAYPHSRLLFFDDGHRMRNDPPKYRAIRVDFLNNGFGRAGG